MINIKTLTIKKDTIAMRKYNISISVNSPMNIVVSPSVREIDQAAIVHMNINK